MSGHHAATTIAPRPPGKGWFRVPCSDAGFGGPGWMRAGPQGNEYHSDAGYYEQVGRMRALGLEVVWSGTLDHDDAVRDIVSEAMNDLEQRLARAGIPRASVVYVHST